MGRPATGWSVLSLRLVLNARRAAACPCCSASGGDFKPTAFEDRPRREFDDRPPRRGGFGFGDRDTSRDGSRDGRPPLPRDNSQDRVWRREGGGGGGEEGAPRERPRLNLAPRSAAPAGEGASGGASKASVFGAARPREEVLKEQVRSSVVWVTQQQPCSARLFAPSKVRQWWAAARARCISGPRWPSTAYRLLLPRSHCAGQGRCQGGSQVRARGGGQVGTRGCGAVRGMHCGG